MPSIGPASCPACAAGAVRQRLGQISPVRSFFFFSFSFSFSFWPSTHSPRPPTHSFASLRPVPPLAVALPHVRTCVRTAPSTLPRIHGWDRSPTASRGRPLRESSGAWRRFRVRAVASRGSDRARARTQIRTHARTYGGRRRGAAVPGFPMDVLPLSRSPGRRCVLARGGGHKSLRALICFGGGGGPRTRSKRGCHCHSLSASCSPSSSVAGDGAPRHAGGRTGTPRRWGLGGRCY